MKHAEKRQGVPLILIRIISACVASVLVFSGLVMAGSRYRQQGSETMTYRLSIRTAKAAATLAPNFIQDGSGVSAGMAAAIKQQFDAFTQSADIGTTYSAVFLDINGNRIAEHDAETAREPASTTKTLTAFAATRQLDLYQTLDTQVLVDGDVTDGKATIVLKGNGDLLLGRGENDPNHVNGRAGIATLVKETASALEDQGVSQVTLEYDDTLFGDKRLPDGIDSNNQDYIFEMPMASMAIDMDRQWGTYVPENLDVQDSAYPPKTATAALNVAKEFASQLSGVGVTVSNADNPESVTTPDDATQIASVSSAPLYEVMRVMLKNSWNTLAEEFGRLIALKMGYENSPAGAAQAVTDTVKAAGIFSDGLSLKDCSGLTQGTRIAALTLAQVERDLVLDEDSDASPMMNAMLVPGIDKPRAGFEAPTFGLERLKTGTLENARALTGTIMLSDGSVVFFATVCQDPAVAWAVSSDEFALANAVGKL